MGAAADVDQANGSSTIPRHTKSAIAPRPSQFDDVTPVEQPMARAAAAPLRILREHWLFSAVLVVSVVPRLIAMLGYPPASWYPDSLPYIQFALHPEPYDIRPIGYSFFLILLEPLHSILVVTAVQHAMGLAMGVATYCLLRLRFRLPTWGATLAALPPLLSVYEIQIEHFVLSDTFFGLLVTLAMVLMLWRPVPRVWACSLAGLLLAWAALARSQGLLLGIPFVLYLATQLVRRTTRPKVLIGIAGMCLLLAVPLLGYAWWFDQVNGSFQLTTSTGAFLYSRVAGFADCSVIKPPADERWLCLSTPVAQRPFEGYYVWVSSSPLHKGPASEFSSTVNSLATDFAVRAIESQPADYLKAVWHSTFETFAIHRDQTPAGQSQSVYMFPAVTPESLQALAPVDKLNYNYAFTYNGGADASTRLVQPYAGWMRAYQRFMIVPGPLLGLIAALGGIGIIVSWRRLGGPALLPFLVGVVLIVTPAATADYDARYVVAAVPAFCIAAALGVRSITNMRRPASEAGHDDTDAADGYAD
jgi:hypothetical protein